MFHQGDLQSGISRAIAEQKLVACFIRSDNEESAKWEQQWLGIGKRPAPIDMFSLKAVILRIEYGSQEMGFLAAFCPVTSSPTFVVIDKGQVLDNIESGATQEEFMTRISKALDLDMHVVNKAEFEKAKAASQTQQQSQSQSQSQQDAPVEESATTSATASHTYEASTDPAASSTPASASSIPTTNTSNTQTQTPSDMQSLFPDRAQRHEEEKLKREAAEKAERTARATARRKEAEAAAAQDKDKGKGKASDYSDKEKSRRDWLAQQKQRKDEAKKDRERVLAQIEADKQERKARSQSEKAETGPSESLLRPSADAASRRRSGPGSMCSLQIRLFDGTSIKSRFEPSATLASTVRDWIKTTTAEQGNTEAADIPFTFKQIMAPQPSRNIEISEEHQSLLELGLTPSATLVLAPVAGYTDAYGGGNAGRGYMSSALHYTYTAVNTTTSLLGSALSYVPGFGPPPSASSTRASNTSSSEDDSSSASNLDGAADASASRGFKVKTLADQRAEAERARRKSESAEFYNGNSSAFQGRKDDDKKD